MRPPRSVTAAELVNALSLTCQAPGGLLPALLSLQLSDARPCGRATTGYILSLMAWPKPEQDTSLTSLRPSAFIRRAKS